jgi:hypothetical protein
LVGFKLSLPALSKLRSSVGLANLRIAANVKRERHRSSRLGNSHAKIFVQMKKLV